MKPPGAWDTYQTTLRSIVGYRLRPLEARRSILLMAVPLRDALPVVLVVATG